MTERFASSVVVPEEPTYENVWELLDLLRQDVSGFRFLDDLTLYPECNRAKLRDYFAGRCVTLVALTGNAPV